MYKLPKDYKLVPTVLPGSVNTALSVIANIRMKLYFSMDEHICMHARAHTCTRAHSQKYYSASERGKFVICNNMGEPGEHFKLDTER